METRFVPDAPGAWLVYDLGTLVLAVPPEFRAAADAVVAMPRSGVAGVIAALQSSGVAPGAPFAVLEATPVGFQLALRGPATVFVGAETLTGLGAEPYLSRSVAPAAVARLTVPGGEWTLTPGAPVAAPPPTRVVPPASLFDDSRDITAVPDLEASVPPPPGSAPVAPVVGEHDGGTVLVSDLPPLPADDKTVVVDEIARLRARRSGGPGAPAFPAPPPPAPRLSLLLPDGSREPLDAVVVVGRAPSAPADGSASRLVRLEGDGDISRNHARVALEGDTVVVTDLGSRNGTIVRIPGRPAQKLRDGEPTPVLVGTVIDFGGGVELSIREG